MDIKKILYLGLLHYPRKYKLHSLSPPPPPPGARPSNRLAQHLRRKLMFERALGCDTKFKKEEKDFS